MKAKFLSLPLRILALAASLTTAVLAQTTNPTQYYFTTLAGTASIGNADGSGSLARFHTPRGIAVDVTGNLYVADTVNCTIRKITPAGLVTTLAGKSGQTGSADGSGSDALFSNPCGLTIDSAGNLFVADTGNAVVRKVTPAGVVTTLAGLARTTGSADGTGSAARFNFPDGITVDAAGTICVADTANNLIRKISAAGVVTTLAGAIGESVSVDGTGTAARFTGPNGIVVDPAGNLYVCEATMIRKITPAGEVTFLAGIPKPIGSADAFGSADGTGSEARFSDPSSITRDVAGNLYVTDPLNCTIRKITLAGVVTTFAGKAGARGFSNGTGSEANFYFPEGIAADQAGNLYVADTHDNNIRKINPAGSVSTLAGLAPAQCAGSTDGLAEAARFYGARGIAVGPAGEIYVADTRNHIIRKIAPTGAVTTLAGLAGEASYADGTGSAARFNFPSDVAVDSLGNVYVADTGNYLIRKITPAGVVSTFAGKPGQSISSDGPVSQATFWLPTAVTLDANGAVFVTDSEAIRKISLDGQVTTLLDYNSTNQIGYGPVVVDGAGTLYTVYSDGNRELSGIAKITPTGMVPLFVATAYDQRPTRLAIDQTGAIFFTCQSSYLVRKISADGSVAIIGGVSGIQDSANGAGSNAHFVAPSGIAVDRAGIVYVTDCDFDLSFPPKSSTIRKGIPGGLPVIATQPLSQTAAVGSNVQISVTAAAVPAPTYQWYFNGNAFSGATSSTLSFANARSSDAGDYTVVVTNMLGSVTSNKATLTVGSAPLPTPTPTPAPASSSGGGGSIEGWFALILMAIGVARLAGSSKAGQ